MWHADGPQGDESSKVCHLVAHYTRGRGLDIGCGPAKLWPTVIGLDRAGADITADGTTLKMFGDGELDFVYSSHFLEHIPDPQAALAEWWRVVKVGGYLTLYLPHQDLYPRVGKPGANPDHKHNLSPTKVLVWMDGVVGRSGQGATVIENEVRDGGDGLNEFSEYSFLLVLQKRADADWSAVEPVRVPKERRLLLMRYGGIGDVLIASTCFPGLKAQGWHLTVATTPQGQAVLRDNPYVDAFIVQDVGQVPDAFLPIYLDRLHERYGRVFLACWEEGLLPDCPDFRWLLPQSIRHEIMNVNYHERMHTLAGVPQSGYECRFYGEPLRPFEGPTIAWAIAGSGKIKVWPHIAQAIIRLLYRTKANIILLGSAGDKPLQDMVFDCVRQWHGFANNRLHGLCGVSDIEGACRIALGADVVVGPETGVLNAVATAPMPKVIMLSHSTPENLTKHWVNARALIPNTPDYPDHRLHNTKLYGPGYRSALDLRYDPVTGSPELAANITVEQVVDAIMEALAHGDDIHDAHRGEDGRRLDQAVGEPRHDLPNGGADRGAGVDLRETARSTNALLNGGDPGLGCLPDHAGNGLSGDDAAPVH